MLTWVALETWLAWLTWLVVEDRFFSLALSLDRVTFLMLGLDNRLKLIDGLLSSRAEANLEKELKGKVWVEMEAKKVEI